MAINLVGIFDSVNEAERAREWLLGQGLARNTLHVTDNTSLMSRSSSAHSGAGAGTGTGTGEGEHRGFFSRLLGLGDADSHADEYSRELQKGSALLTAIVENESEARRVEELMAQAGADVIDERGGRSVQDPERTQAQGRAGLDQGATLEVMQEELQVGKRSVETGGVRIRQHVTERPVHEQIQLCEEHAIVERVPVNREASPDELDRLSLEDREIEIRERAEQAVVAKTARVVEEVRVGKEVTGHTEEIDDTVRRTDVDVEQLTAAQQAAQRQGMRGDQPRR